MIWHSEAAESLGGQPLDGIGQPGRASLSTLDTADLLTEVLEAI